jgi:hypothetical protein
MIEVLAVSISCAVSVVAIAFAILSLKAADPLAMRKLSANVSASTADLENKIQNLADVELPRLEARCEAILDRAELKFDSAEAKRKSVAARQQHLGGPDRGGNGIPRYADETLPRAERLAALEREAAQRGL